MFHDKSRFCANILRTLLNTRLIWTNFLLKLQEEFNLYFVLLRTLSKVLSTVLCPKVNYTLYWVLYSVQKWSILYTEYCTLSKSEVYFILSTVLCSKVKYTLYWVLYSVQKWSILYTEYCTLFKSEVYFILSTVLCPSLQSEVYFILSTVLCPKVKYTLAGRPVTSQSSCI